MNVKLLKDLSQWRLKNRIPAKRKYVIYSQDLNTPIKAPFGVVTAISDEPITIFNAYHSSQSLPSSSNDLNHPTSSTCSKLSQTEPVGKDSVAIQTEVRTWDTQTDCQLTASLWKTELANDKFQQQNKNFLNKLNFSLRCVNRSRANEKACADRAEFELEVSE